MAEAITQDAAVVWYLGIGMATSWSENWKSGSIFQWCESTTAASNAEELRQYIASRTNMSGLAGNDTPAAGSAVDHLCRSLKSLSGLAGNDTPAAGDAVDHLRRSLKSLGPEAAVPGLKPATPVKK
ncbi:hypothetical protein MRX96_054561 [Rhipicephalus microplus]